jgi:hypothetical protein
VSGGMKDFGPVFPTMRRFDGPDYWARIEEHHRGHRRHVRNLLGAIAALVVAAVVVHPAFFGLAVCLVPVLLLELWAPYGGQPRTWRSRSAPRSPADTSPVAELRSCKYNLTRQARGHQLSTTAVHSVAREARMELLPALARTFDHMDQEIVGVAADQRANSPPTHRLAAYLGRQP